MHCDKCCCSEKNGTVPFAWVILALSGAIDYLFRPHFIISHWRRSRTLSPAPFSPLVSIAVSLCLSIRVREQRLERKYSDRVHCKEQRTENRTAKSMEDISGERRERPVWSGGAKFCLSSPQYGQEFVMSWASVDKTHSRLLCGR